MQNEKNNEFLDRLISQERQVDKVLNLHAHH